MDNSTAALQGFNIENVYLVGGAVRDELLGLAVHERDYVVIGATAAQMQAWGFEPVGKDFPVFLHPVTHEEYALARSEKKQGHGYTGFLFNTENISLETDLKRRDLTINAMAKSQTGQLIDPYGGQQDLANRVLRHVSDAFLEDPLRVLRVARFAARFFTQQFKIDKQTLRLMQQMSASGELNHLTPERVSRELFKALETETPAVFFGVLRNVGALADWFLELDALFLVEQNACSHPELNAGVHTLMTLTEGAKRKLTPLQLFALLCHDFGKANTDPAQLPSHTGHEAQGEALVKTFCERLKVSKKYRDFALKVTRYHGQVHAFATLSADAIVALFKAFAVHKDLQTFSAFIACCEVDSAARLGVNEATTGQGAKMALRLAYRFAQQDFTAVIRAGMSGAEIQAAVHAAQIRWVEENRE